MSIIVTDCALCHETIKNLSTIHPILLNGEERFICHECFGDLCEQYKKQQEIEARKDGQE